MDLVRCQATVTMNTFVPNGLSSTLTVINFNQHDTMSVSMTLVDFKYCLKLLGRVLLLQTAKHAEYSRKKSWSDSYCTFR